MHSSAIYMPEEVLPPERNRDANSNHRLSRLEIQQAITDVKGFIEGRLESDLHLTRVRNRLLVSPLAEKVSVEYLMGLRHE